MSEALGLTVAEEVFAYELAGRITTTAVQLSRRARKRPLVTCAAFSFALLRLMREDAKGNGHRKTKTRKRKPRG
jgi:hypothetical protein